MWNPVSTRPSIGGITGRPPAAIKTFAAASRRPSTSSSPPPPGKRPDEARRPFDERDVRRSGGPVVATRGGDRVDPPEHTVADRCPVGAVEARRDPELVGVLRFECSIGGQHEHLRRDAPPIEAGPSEHAALDDGDLPVGEEVRDRVARSGADDDQVEVLWAAHTAEWNTARPPNVPRRCMLRRRTARCCVAALPDAASQRWPISRGRVSEVFPRRSGDGFIRCSDGHIRWGVYGAAGVVFVWRGPNGPEVMLQRRSMMAHEGGTWSCAGGALDQGETPVIAALREAAEEVGPTPGQVRLLGQYVFAAGDGLDLHDHRRRGRGAVRRLDQLRDRCGRLVPARRSGPAPAAPRVRGRMATSRRDHRHESTRRAALTRRRRPHRDRPHRGGIVQTSVGRGSPVVSAPWLES